MKTDRNLWPLAIIVAFIIFLAGTLGLVALRPGGGRKI
jgi:hypothetical protein